MEFREMSINEFNFYQDTNLDSEMSFTEAVCNIEENDNNYFYVSMNHKDIEEAFENEEDIVQQLELDNIFIKELGIYISLQP